MKQLLAVCIFMITLYVNGFPAETSSTARILCPDANPQAPIRIGIDEIERVLRAQNWSVIKEFGPKPVATSSAKLEIVVSPFDGELHKSDNSIFKDVVAENAESCAILVFPYEQSLRVYAVGSDPVGTMYASFTIAEQLEFSSSKVPIQKRITEMKHTPTHALRGIQLMIHRQAIEDAFSWFHSETFWSSYLDTLCRNRFNHLELQGVFDLITTELSSLYPYFFKTPPFVTIGVDHPTADRNLASFKRIIRMAHQRGITLTLINSGTSVTSAFGEYLDPNEVKQYSIRATEQLLKECPDLDGLGFQALSSMTLANHFHQVFIDPLNASVSKPLLFIPAEQSKPAPIRSLIRRYQGLSMVKVMFNADHLGLSYPIGGGRMAQWTGYSYEDYFNQPRKHGVVYQIGCGSNRIFPWGDANFIRKTIKNTAISDSNGIILQTYATYAPHADTMTNTLQSDLRYYTWAFERDWYWYALWGRLAYNAEEPQSTFTSLFRIHFGEQAGPILFDALQKVSQVMPALTASVYLGPKNAHYIPEMEPPLSVQEALMVEPLDAAMIRSVSDEIHALVHHTIDSRQSPVDVLLAASQAAAEGVRLAESAIINLGEDQLSTQRNRELNAWRLDFQALDAMGRYWYHQINAAVLVGVYQALGDIPSLVLAGQNSNQAADAWEQVRSITSRRYRPFIEPFRIQALNFHWKHYASSVNTDQQLITDLYTEWVNRTTLPENLGHFKPNRATPGDEVLLTLCIPPTLEMEGLTLSFQNYEGTTKRLPMEPSKIDGVYFAEIHPKFVIEGALQYFFRGVTISTQEALALPKEGSTYLLPVTLDQQPPEATDVKFHENRSKKMVNLSGTITDPSGVKSLNVIWKPFPSGADWQRGKLSLSGKTIRGSVPLTPEGVIFFIEAVDGYGNLLRIPSRDKMMPYWLVAPYTMN